ncbi:MAG: hypothetical protein QGG73_13710, partial [Candidatus Hydrogenedentes bacterium]|nr:hypothetical protein [Candidatus Hydrogenedentota bacterium]
GAEWYAKHFGGTVTKSGSYDAVKFGDKLIKMRKRESELGGGVGLPVDHISFSVLDVAAKSSELKSAGLSVKAGGRMRNNKGVREQATARLTDPWGTKIEVLMDEDITGFHHVHLKSQTSVTAAEWYAKAFGGKMGNFKDAPAIRAVRFDNMYIFVQRTIRAATVLEEPPVDHIGWQTSNFDADVTRLRGMDARFITDPAQIDGRRVAVIEGPDSVKIELIETVSN